VKKAGFAGLALLLLLVATFALLPASALAQIGAAQLPTGADTQYLNLSAPSGTFTLTAKEQLVIQLVNKARASRGLAPVRANVALVKAARGHSAEMVHKRYFSHDSYSGRSFAYRLVAYGYSRTGYRSWATGECIAWGQGLLGTPQAIVKAWMRSTSHRAIILTPKFRDVGVGVHSGSYQGGAFFFTLDFGKRSR
jgi:uncharacterized protein YkwD